MREVVIHSFEELQDVIFRDCYDEKTMRYRNNYVYRGVVDKDYKLISKLNRVCSHNLHLEEAIMRSFRKYGYADVKDIGSFWQIAAMGQHYSLPTRLLDWTYSPLVAAHFATEDYEGYDRDGVIYCFDLNEVQKQLPAVLRQELIEKETEVFTINMLDRHMKDYHEMQALSEKPYFLFYEPASGSDRMANQYALFAVCSDTRYTLQDLIDVEEHKSLYRIILPKEVKLEIRDKLDYINISERLIYPGLDGICRWITRRYADLGPVYGRKK
ncbi:MAG: FRG domain-containing protein [Erysipelotrichaceae bacterium]|nr:FRG domain-containing protein [Erysipelotrichaceae bacterium]